MKTLIDAARQAIAILDQPVQHSNTRTANAIQILRADAETARIILTQAVEAKPKAQRPQMPSVSLYSHSQEKWYTEDCDGVVKWHETPNTADHSALNNFIDYARRLESMLTSAN